MVGPHFEVGGKATYTNVSDLDSEFGVEVNAIYHFTPTWGVTASYQHANLLEENMDTWGVGVRASF